MSIFETPAFKSLVPFPLSPFPLSLSSFLPRGDAARTSRETRKGAVAPQPTHFKVFGANPSVLTYKAEVFLPNKP
ncbi:hypothetical protein GXM_04352 [Nostoc sphaeroides CCNUC1]|uniref:Uncharacterized protein n=1 Tax=Nostoc sphaeroides CCNUC1 TaxID=2653204 RepID=A0A5P8W2R9_9NOSO|nr:hypothetical protein GXM_04352 [Nostoc sphaeroides CCNUC1]